MPARPIVSEERKNLVSEPSMQVLPGFADSNVLATNGVATLILFRRMPT
jgi:hypothetical protein